MEHLTPENAKTVVRDLARQRVRDVPFLVTAARNGWELEEPFTHEHWFARYDWKAEDFIIEKHVLMEHPKIKINSQDDD